MMMLSFRGCCLSSLEHVRAHESEIGLDRALAGGRDGASRKHVATRPYES